MTRHEQAAPTYRYDVYGNAYLIGEPQGDAGDEMNAGENGAQDSGARWWAVSARVNPKLA